MKIEDKDVTAAVLSADIYQDVYGPTWTAQVFFDDTSNLLTRLPIKAGKKITIKIETKYDGKFAGDGVKEFELMIYKVGDKRFVNHMEQEYTVFCAHESFFKNQSKRIRRSFKNQKADVVAASLIKEGLGGQADTHPADNSISLVIPNWSPFNAVSWLCKVGVSNGSADYCLFQTDNNKFAFKSFERMYSGSDEKKELTFVQRPAGMKKKGDYDDDFTLHVVDYAWHHFDGASGTSSGLYKSRTVTYDVIEKKWEQKDFTYGDDCPADSKGKNFEDDIAGPESNISFVPRHKGMFSAGKSVGDFSDDWVASRKSSLQKMDMERLVIQIAGSVKAWEWLGKNVMVDLPSQQDQQDEKLDKLRKGKYVIVAICHNVKKSSYATNIEMVKKRLER